MSSKIFRPLFPTVCQWISESSAVKTKSGSARGYLPGNPRQLRNNHYEME